MNERGIDSQAVNTIVKARITHLPERLGDRLPEVWITLSDGTEKMLFTYYLDEISRKSIFILAPQIQSLPAESGLSGRSRVFAISPPRLVVAQASTLHRVRNSRAPPRQEWIVHPLCGPDLGP